MVGHATFLPRLKRFHSGHAGFKFAAWLLMWFAELSLWLFLASAVESGFRLSGQQVIDPS